MVCAQGKPFGPARGKRSESYAMRFGLAGLKTRDHLGKGTCPPGGTVRQKARKARRYRSAENQADGVILRSSGPEAVATAAKQKPNAKGKGANLKVRHYTGKRKASGRKP